MKIRLLIIIILVITIVGCKSEPKYHVDDRLSKLVIVTDNTFVGKNKNALSLIKQNRMFDNKEGDIKFIYAQEVAAVVGVDKSDASVLQIKMLTGLLSGESFFINTQYVSYTPTDIRSKAKLDSIKALMIRNKHLDNLTNDIAEKFKFTLYDEKLNSDANLKTRVAELDHKLRFADDGLGWTKLEFFYTPNKLTMAALDITLENGANINNSDLNIVPKIFETIYPNIHGLGNNINAGIKKVLLGNDRSIKFSADNVNFSITYNNTDPKRPFMYIVSTPKQ